mmetsp:Transcript_6628/g.20704  ORF Transcript_6628/g.20704 Transcript_6628/m.20704 type:complete len:337 (+) Transcript_6628:82-1092(+)
MRLPALFLSNLQTCGALLAFLQAGKTHQHLFEKKKALDVRAEITYRVNDGLPHWQLARTLEDGEDAEGGTASAERVLIRDARRRRASFETRGFELFEGADTALDTADFYDSATVESTYYKETEALLEQRFEGCAKAFVFSHSVRDASLQGTGLVQGYGYGAHVDVAPNAAAEIFAGMLPHAQASCVDRDLRSGRCLLVNAWRNVRHDKPVSDTPLALCDATSVVAPDDFVPFTLETDLYRVVQYRLGNAHAQRHRWYYFPLMTSDELLVFKQWDSDVTRPARSCFHCAFDLPDQAPGQANRQSIEVRALLFFPDHTPNTCPDLDAAFGPPADDAAR